MQIIGEILVVIATGISSYSLWLLQNNRKKKDLTQEALKLLMKKELREVQCMCKERGYITVTEMEHIAEVYEIYHNMGGNGTGTLLYENMKSMEVK